MNDDDLPVYDADDVPEDAGVLQNGVIVGDDGPIGRINPDDTTPDLE